MQVENGTYAPKALAVLLEAADPDTETRAWAAFLQVYTPVLIGVARSLGGEYDTTMDRYEFILERLRRDRYARLRRYSPRHDVAFAGWLRVVARRLCFDLHRHQRGRARGVRNPGGVASHLLRGRLQALHGVPLDAAEAFLLSESDPAAGMDHRETIARLRHATARLAPADQELLRLRFEQELPAVEIARRMGASSQFHVYRRLRRILTGLRSEVEGLAVARQA